MRFRRRSRLGYRNPHHNPTEVRMKSIRKPLIAILIGLSLVFGAAAAISTASHSTAATMVEYAL
jgi:hypothetical protein